MNESELEKKKLEDFLARAKNFLANDPYFVYLLTVEGGRPKRRKLAREFAKLLTTIPHFEKQDPLTRENRRALKL